MADIANTGWIGKEIWNYRFLKAEVVHLKFNLQSLENIFTKFDKN